MLIDWQNSYVSRSKQHTSRREVQSHEPVNKVKKKKFSVHTAKPLAPKPSPSEVEITIAKSERYKSPGSEQILREVIQAGSETLHSKIHMLINFIWDKQKLLKQWKESITAPT
jgi:hypothetical protein